VFTVWWLFVFPGLAIVLTAMAFNVAGDALRDALDPRQVGRQ
jgi:peptide/nickel transport system permease protein